MRLLNTHTLELEFDRNNRFTTPPYAILSHTWNVDPTKEVTFHDIRTLSYEDLKKHQGFKKIQYTCAQAVKDGYSHAWIDSCCIDKSSSAELSEAINSMFDWYSRAEVCYTYLSDVTSNAENLLSEDLYLSDGTSTAENLLSEDSSLSDGSLSDGTSTAEESLSEQFRRSRWFSRGWTLQELLAPKIVRFFDSSWKYLGTSDHLVDDITQITSIAKSFLYPKARPQLQLESASVAQKMSWATKRETTRVEDEAYSLLGLFQVNIPLLYGEGKRAFFRLQEEIMKVTTDHSIFVWNRTGAMLLADSPRGFFGKANISWSQTRELSQPFSLTNAGLKIRIPITHDEISGFYYCLLNCYYKDEEVEEQICLQIESTESENLNQNKMWRFQKPFRLKKGSKSKWAADLLAPKISDQTPEITVLNLRRPHYTVLEGTKFELDELFIPKCFIKTEFKIVEVYPYSCWNEAEMALSWIPDGDPVLGIFIMRTEARSFAVVLITQERTPTLIPAIFITGVSEPVDIYRLTRLAKRNRSALLTTGCWKCNNTGDEISYSSERYRYAATWIHKISITSLLPKTITDNVQTTIFSNNSGVSLGSSSAPVDQGVQNTRLVLALDYGNTYTGFAFAVTDGSASTLYDIHVACDWGIDNRNTSKLRNAQCYDIHCGYDPADWPNYLPLDVLSIVNAKTDLETHGNLYVRINSIRKDLEEIMGQDFNHITTGDPHQRQNGKTPSEIIEDFLTIVFQRLLENCSIFDFLSVPVKVPVDFVITVPGHWSYGELDSLFQAVNSAFKLNETFPMLVDVLAISETEATVNYAVQFLIENGHNNFKVGDAFVLCNADEDQVSAVSYMIKSLNPITLEPVGIAPARGQGSLVVNDRFESWFKGLLPRHYAHEIIRGKVRRQIMRDFLASKSSYVKGRDVVVDLPESLHRLKLAGFIIDGELKIDHETMESFFNTAVHEILEAIQSQVIQLEENGSKTKSIILIDSSEGSPYLKNEVTTAFQELQGIPVCIPHDGWNAVVRGAVLYGMEKDRVGRALRRLDPVTT